MKWNNFAYETLLKQSHGLGCATVCIVRMRLKFCLQKHNDHMHWYTDSDYNSDVILQYIIGMIWRGHAHRFTFVFICLISIPTYGTGMEKWVDKEIRWMRWGKAEKVHMKAFLPHFLSRVMFKLIILQVLREGIRVFWLLIFDNCLQFYVDLEKLL